MFLKGALRSVLDGRLVISRGRSLGWYIRIFFNKFQRIIIWLSLGLMQYLWLVYNL